MAVDPAYSAASEGLVGEDPAVGTEHFYRTCIIDADAERGDKQVGERFFARGQDEDTTDSHENGGTPPIMSHSNSSSVSKFEHLNLEHSEFSDTSPALSPEYRFADIYSSPDESHSLQPDPEGYEVDWTNS